MAQPGKAKLEVIEGGRTLDQRAALKELYSKYGGSVYGRCRYLLRDKTQAEDAMQDVFAKAISRYPDLRIDSSPLNWLMKIATHHCLNILRGERSWRRTYERARQVQGDPPHGPHSLEIREAVRNLMARFDLETQAAAIHYHVDEMTLEEVAATLKRSVPTIRKRLQHFAEESGQEWK